MGCTRISYTLTKLVLWAVLFTVNFQQDRSPLGPASTTSKFLSIVSIVEEKDKHIWTGSKYLLKESWQYCMCHSTCIKRAMYNTIQMCIPIIHIWIHYTVHKKTPVKFNPCMNTYSLSTTWFDYKMFSSAKEKKRDLNITTWNEPSFTSLWRMLFWLFYWSTCTPIEAECGHVSKKEYPIKKESVHV